MNFFTMTPAFIVAGIIVVPFAALLLSYAEYVVVDLIPLEKYRQLTREESLAVNIRRLLLLGGIGLVFVQCVRIIKVAPRAAENASFYEIWLPFRTGLFIIAGFVIWGVVCEIFKPMWRWLFQDAEKQNARRKKEEADALYTRLSRRDSYIAY